MSSVVPLVACLSKPKMKVISTLGEKKASFAFEPLENGYGITLGNALRRVLLSSIVGYAVTKVKLSGILHEFSAIPGVREDFFQFIVNIKGIVISGSFEGKRTIVVRHEGGGVLCVGDLQETSDLKFLNPEHILLHLEEGSAVEFSLTIESGVGYILNNMAEGTSFEDEVGAVSIDALFSPVRSVSYRVEKTREGNDLNYDRLLLDVETTGAVSPEKVLSVAAHLLQEQLASFVTCHLVSESTLPEKEVEGQGLPDLNPLLFKKVDELELSVRSANCLKNDNIVYIGDLVCKSETDMLRTPNFGRKSLNEIKEILVQMGLRLGMHIDDWPPDNVDEFAKQFDSKF